MYYFIAVFFLMAFNNAYADWGLQPTEISGAYVSISLLENCSIERPILKTSGSIASPLSFAAASNDCLLIKAEASGQYRLGGFTVISPEGASTTLSCPISGDVTPPPPPEEPQPLEEPDDHSIWYGEAETDCEHAIWYGETCEKKEKKAEIPEPTPEPPKVEVFTMQIPLSNLAFTEIRGPKGSIEINGEGYHLKALADGFYPLCLSVPLDRSLFYSFSANAEGDFYAPSNSAHLLANDVIGGQIYIPGERPFSITANWENDGLNVDIQGTGELNVWTRLPDYQLRFLTDTGWGDRSFVFPVSGPVNFTISLPYKSLMAGIDRSLLISLLSGGYEMHINDLTVDMQAGVSGSNAPQDAAVEISTSRDSDESFVLSVLDRNINALGGIGTTENCSFYSEIAGKRLWRQPTPSGRIWKIYFILPVQCADVPDVPEDVNATPVIAVSYDKVFMEINDGEQTAILKKTDYEKDGTHYNVYWTSLTYPAGKEIKYKGTINLDMGYIIPMEFSSGSLTLPVPTGWITPERQEDAISIPITLDNYAKTASLHLKMNIVRGEDYSGEFNGALELDEDDDGIYEKTFTVPIATIWGLMPCEDNPYKDMCLSRSDKIDYELPLTMYDEPKKIDFRFTVTDNKGDMLPSPLSLSKVSVTIPGLNGEPIMPSSSAEMTDQRLHLAWGATWGFLTSQPPLNLYLGIEKRGRGVIWLADKGMSAGGEKRPWEVLYPDNYPSSASGEISIDLNQIDPFWSFMLQGSYSFVVCIEAQGGDERCSVSKFNI